MPSPADYSDLGPGVIVGVASDEGMTYRQGDRQEHWTDVERAEWRRKVRGGDDFRPPVQENAMSQLQKYLAWLLWLQTLSTNIPAFLSAALAFYEAVKGLLPPTPELEAGGGLSLTRSLDDELNPRSTDPLVEQVCSAELAVLEQTDGDRSLAIRDGSRLRELFAFFMLLRGMFGF